MFEYASYYSKARAIAALEDFFATGEISESDEPVIVQRDCSYESRVSHSRKYCILVRSY